MINLDPDKAIAFALKCCTKGAGTADDALVFLTCRFADWMRGEHIQGKYQQFGDMKKDITRDLTGKYQDMVLALWKL
jgi:hypothetical protein